MSDDLDLSKIQTEPSGFLADYYESKITQKPEDYQVEGGVKGSLQSRLNEAFPAIPDTSESFIGRAGQSLARGLYQGEDVAGGLTMMAGEAIGSDSLKSYGESLTIGAERGNIRNQSPVPTYSDIDGVGDFFEYATASIMEMLPLNIALMATGIGGAGIAGKIATGAFRGAITREVAAGITDEMITKFGIEGAKQEFAKVLAKDAASKAAQQTGARLGVGAGSSLVETGSDASQINKETGTTGGLPTLALGIAGGATDAFGGESKALTNILTGSAGDKAIGAAKHMAKSVGGVVAAEVPQELLQNTLSQTALQVQTPEKNQFGQKFLNEQIDTVFKTAIGVLPLGGVSGLATLPPSKDPAVRTQEADIQSKVASNLDIDPLDMKAAEDALNADDPATPESKLIIANDKLASINERLSSDEFYVPQGKPDFSTGTVGVLPDKQKEFADLQEQRKQAIEEVKSLEAQIAGYSTDTYTKSGKPYRPSKPSPFYETGLPAPNEAAGNEWLDSHFQPETEPEKVSLNQKIRMAMKPFANMWNAHGFSFSLTDDEKSHVGWDDEGNFTIKLNRNAAKNLSPERWFKEVEEEGIHSAHIIGDRINWIATGRAVPFREFTKRESRRRAGIIRAASSSRTIGSLAMSYVGDPTAFDLAGKTEEQQIKADIALDREFHRALAQKVRTGETSEDLKVLEAAEAKGDMVAKSTLDLMLTAIQNLKEVLVRFINPKTAPKEIKATVDQINKILDKYADRLPKKAKPVVTSEEQGGAETPKANKKPVAANVEQTETPPEEPKTNKSEDITEGMSGMAGGITENFYQGLFDAFNGTDNAFAKNEKNLLAKLEQFRDQIKTPQDIRDLQQSGKLDKASAGDELFQPTEHGQYFETQDFNGTPTGTTLIRTEVPKGQDPAAAIKATQKYRDLARKGKIFSSGKPFEIPKDNAFAGGEVSDFKNQLSWIDNEARAQGFDGITDLAKHNPRQYDSLAKRWRILHPKDHEGNLTSERNKQAVEDALYPAGNRGIGADDSLGNARAFLRTEENTVEGSDDPFTQSELLRQWAENEGRVIENLPFALNGEEDMGEGEHHVFALPDSNRILKVTKWNDEGYPRDISVTRNGWSLSSGTAENYLTSIQDANDIIGDDNVLHGIFTDENGRSLIVTSQPLVVGVTPTNREIELRMDAAGFEQVDKYAFYRPEDNTFIADLHEENAFLVDDALVPFDVIAMHPEQNLIDAIRKVQQAMGFSGHSAFAGNEIPQHDQDMTEAVTGFLRGVDVNRKDRDIISRAANYIGITNPNLITVSRAEGDMVDTAVKYITNHGFLEAMRNVSAGTLGGMYGPDQAFLRGVMVKFALPIAEELKRDARIPARQRTDIYNEILDMRANIQKRFAENATKQGREVQAHSLMKRVLFDGDSAMFDMEEAIFNAAQTVEPWMSRENLAEIYHYFKETAFKAIDRILTEREFLVKVGAVVSRAINNPEKLHGDIRSAIRKGQAGARAVRRAVARIGNEIMSSDGEAFVNEIARKVAFQIDATAPSNPARSGKGFLEQALEKFAKDHFPKEKRAPIKTKNKNLNILRAIIANDKLKEQFIDSLEKEVASQYKKGTSDPQFKKSYEYAFALMRSEGWSEDIRKKATADIKSQLGLSVGKMLSSGAWQDDKASVISLLKSHIGEICSDEQIARLVDEVNADLDQEAEIHLSETFGFKRNEDGTYATTDKGQLKGGQGLRRAIKKIGVSLKDLTTISYGTRMGEINKLAKLATEELGLPEEMALKVQAILSKELENAVEFTKDAELKKRIERANLKNKESIPETKSVIDKLVQYANQGFLDEKSVYESIRKNYKNSKLPEYRPEIGEMVRKWGNEMSMLPEGIAKNEIRQTIANELANIEGISLKDSIKSYWYFSLLSGPSTSMVNAVYNFANLMATATAMSADNPATATKVWSTILRELTNPNSSSWAKFSYTMQTGLVPVEVSAKFGSTLLKKGSVTEVAQLPIERINKENAVTWYQKILYRLSRGIFTDTKFEISARSLSRFMAATDMLFRTAGAQAALSWQGVTITQDMVNSATAQARMEMPEASDAKIRTRADEIVRQNLSINPDTQYAVERAEHIGMEVAFTQDPKGLIGSLARFLGKMGEKYPALILPLFPFTKIVANVWNETLNYTPVGAVRYGFAKAAESKGGKTDWTILDKNGKDIADSLQIRKAIIGSIVMTLVYLATSRDDDDIEIFGVGPKDKQKRIAFFERGMKPYTIRFRNTSISYQYLGPLSSVFGIIGALADVHRNSSGTKKTGWDKFTETFFSAAASVMTTQLAQSFLSSASNMVDAMYSTSPSSGLQKWAAMQTSSVMPNVIRQINNDWINRDTYKSSTFYGQVMAGMGLTKMIGTQPSLNYFGDQIKRREVPLIGRFASLLGGDKVIEEIDSMGLRLPSYANVLNGNPMTDEQSMIFRKTAGPQLKQSFTSIMPILRRLVEAGKKEEAQSMLEESASKINKAARAKMIGAMRP